MKPTFTIVLLLLLQTLSAQDTLQNTWAQKLKTYKIQPIVAFQMWSTYTSNFDIYNEATGEYETTDSRWNSQIRRIRLGVKGQPYPNLSFNINTAFDFVGRDALTGNVGGSNNTNLPGFGLWNAFLQWKMTNKNDAFHLTAGYFPAQIGRESITPASKVTSLEKSWSQNYLRRHLVGRGPGRTTGFNLGGMFLNEKKNFGVSYDVGVFNPIYPELSGNSTGAKFSPLAVARVVFHIGDPEFDKYSMGHKVNYFGKRNGISIALAAASQGETNLYKSNSALGFDWLANWGNFNFNGEWTILSREGERLVNTPSAREFTVENGVGFVRASYNIVLENKKIIEPSIMLMQFSGVTGTVEQADALAVNGFAGEDRYIDISLNFYVNPNFKLTLTYMDRSGDLGDAAPGATFNNYFFQGGVGAIQRGDYLGIGLMAGF